MSIREVRRATMAYFIDYTDLHHRLNAGSPALPPPPGDRSPSRTPPSPVSQTIFPSSFDIRTKVNYLLLQFKETPSLFPDEELYHTETIAFNEPATLATLLGQFEDDHPALQQVCQLQYTTETTASLARCIYANRVKGIYDSQTPFVVNVLVLNKQGHFFPVTAAKAQPREVKITRRGDRTTHIIIRLVYAGEAIRYYNNDSIKYRYQTLLNKVLLGNGAWARFQQLMRPLQIENVYEDEEEDEDE